MKFLAVILALALAMPLSAVAWAPANGESSVSYSQKEAQHKAFHWIILTNDSAPSPSGLNIERDAAAGCTAYAISKHVLLTAQHCDLPDAKLLIDTMGSPHDDQVLSQAVPIVEKVYDGRDHMLLVVPSVTFKDTIKYEPKKFRLAVQGEQVYFWGNPDWFHNMYREGYLMGIILTDADEDLAPVGSALYVFDMNGNHGDSGSAIFSAKDGRIVGIVTYGLQDAKYIGSYVLSFTPEQVKEAEGRK
jgi:hypothetical protein